MKQTVGKWRTRFLARRVDGLLDEPRPGVPRTVTDAKVEEVVRLTLETKPREATHWSTRAMAARCDLSQSTVTRIWRAFGLQPHRTETFKLSPDTLFVEKVRDIVGLYLDPPDRALVLCVDGKSQIQAWDRTQPLLPMRPGQPERSTHDYVQHGTTSWRVAATVRLMPTSRTHRELVTSAYDVKNRLASTVGPRQTISLAVNVLNDGKALWLSRPGAGEIALEWRWLLPESSHVISRGFVPLRYDVPPKGHHEFLLAVDAPSAPDTYMLQFGLVSITNNHDEWITSVAPISVRIAVGVANSQLTTPPESPPTPGTTKE